MSAPEVDVNPVDNISASPGIDHYEVRSAADPA
jgi:hypothetical protein